MPRSAPLFVLGRFEELFLCVWNCDTQRSRESTYSANYFLPRLASVANGGFFLSNALRDCLLRLVLRLRRPAGTYSPAIPELTGGGRHRSAWRVIEWIGLVRR